MHGAKRMKRATVILIALSVAVIYALAMVGCIMLINNDRDGMLSVNNSSYASSENNLDISSTDSFVSVPNTNSDTTSLNSNYISSTSSELTSSDLTSDVSSENSSITSSDTTTSNTASSNTNSITSSEQNSTIISSTGSTSSNTPPITQKQSFTSAIWYSYYELDFRSDNEASFKQKIDKMFDDAKELCCDAVIVQVRPFADALYYSEYFPMSVYMTGTQGKDPGYDPLKYMVSAAHSRNLQIHAWLNPYRISATSTNVNSLAVNHPARKWYNSGDTEKMRNVLTYKSGIYFNPSSIDVQRLIIDGVREIVRNYNVDGIHFDDYFYPYSNAVDSDFDKPEYLASGTSLSLDDWRRANVNALISGVYSAIKAIDKNVQFGISPSYHISQNGTDDNYKIKYADIAKWMNSSGFIDYIAPQIYFGYDHPIADYTTVLDRWLSIKRKSNVKLYIGLAAYKIDTVDANTNEWKTDDDILARQTKEAKQKGCDGVFIFSYSEITSTDSLTKAQYTNLKQALKQIIQE